MSVSTVGNLSPAPASAQVVAQHAATLLAALVLADGTIDPDELALARKACEEFAVPLELLDRALGEVSGDPMQSFTATLLQVEHPADRERLASILFELASVDEKLDTREVQLLKAMQQSWGVSVAFLNKPIEWDDDQRRVIRSNRSDNLLISAGPGMGKTAVACSRVAHLVEAQNVSDSNIWLVSFTRSAIAELKGRIGDFAEDPSNVFAVKISTIDSQAWKIRYGFSPEQVEKLFGGFETGIDAALGLIDERIDDFKDIFGDLEHLIIDEAQDITGGRARFLLKLISLLPPGCGVTVFHDPAQAIYDYAVKGEELFRFCDGLKAQLGTALREDSLKKIYRTDEAPLLKLYEDLRLDILGNADVGSDEFKSKAELVKSAAVSHSKGFDQASLDGYDDALVLFRKRIEVAQASAFMAGDGHPHRLRMSGMGRMPLPWLALILGDTEGRALDRSAFAERWKAARDTYPPLLFGEDVGSNSADARWERLRRYASAPGGQLDLWKLRARLAGSPPDEFVAPEFGHRGPILGTIHASKGREADHVFLQINDNWGGRSGQDEQDFSEEARVLFVGATRAKRSLAVQGGFAMKYATETESGRSFRKARKSNGYQFQIGLQGDFDPYSPLLLKQPLNALANSDLPQRCTARLERGTWIWRVSTDDGIELGTLSKRVTNDLYEISKKYHGPKRRLYEYIRNIHLMGFGTMVAAPGDERLAGARGAAAASGFWLVPQLCGLPVVYV